MKKMPQLRILATNFCEARCVYCKPLGEGNSLGCRESFIKLDEVIEISKIYKTVGGDEIKITGGDPVFWPHLIECVSILKNELNFKNVEIITRSCDILKIVDRLIEAGLDVLNFSLDTLNKKTYEKVTGCLDFDDYIDVIKQCCNRQISCKINTVIMKEVNHNEIEDLINFCSENKVKQLKLLDIIVDMQENETETRANLKDLYINLDYINDILNKKSLISEIVYQGGLGHPMNKYTFPSQLEVMIKNSKNGSWYNEEECIQCCHYPCHDALMAVRLCPDQVIQMCLLNSTKNIHYTDENRMRSFLKMINIFQSAFLISDYSKLSELT